MAKHPDAAVAKGAQLCCRACKAELPLGTCLVFSVGGDPDEMQRRKREGWDLRVPMRVECSECEASNLVACVIRNKDLLPA